MVDPYQKEGDTIRFRLDSKGDKACLIGIILFFGLIPFSSFFASDTNQHPWGLFLSFALLSWPFGGLIIKMVTPGLGAILEIDKTSIRMVRRHHVVWSVLLKNIAGKTKLESHSLCKGIELLDATGRTLAIIPTATIPFSNLVALSAIADVATQPCPSLDEQPRRNSSTSNTILIPCAIIGNAFGIWLLIFAVRQISDPGYLGSYTPGLLMLTSLVLAGIGISGVVALIGKLVSSRKPLPKVAEAPALTLNDALIQLDFQKTKSTRKVFAYPELLQKFDSKGNVRITWFVIGLVNLFLDGCFFGMWFATISKTKQIAIEPAGLSVLVLAILTVATLSCFAPRRYLREIQEITENLGDCVVLECGELFVIRNGVSSKAKVLQSAKPNFTRRDSSGLNAWRLILEVDGATRVYDPSCMVEV